MSRNPYVRPIPRYGWWLRQGRYVRYMAREVSCIFIGVYTAILLVGLMRLGQGPEAWQAFLDGLNSPIAILFHLLAVAFTVWHSMSWFNVTPRAMRIQLGDEFAPDAMIVGVHYGGWILVSIIVLGLAGM